MPRLPRLFRPRPHASRFNQKSLYESNSNVDNRRKSKTRTTHVDGLQDRMRVFRSKPPYWSAKTHLRKTRRYRPNLSTTYETNDWSKEDSERVGEKYRRRTHKRRTHKRKTHKRKGRKGRKGKKGGKGRKTYRRRR